MKIERKHFQVSHVCYTAADNRFVLHPMLDGKSNRAHGWAVFIRDNMETQFFPNYKTARAAFVEIINHA